VNGDEYPEPERSSPDGLTKSMVAHPGWRDPRWCVEADGDVEHCSESVSVRTWDAWLELVWVRRDEAGHPGATELRIEITYERPGGPQAQLFLMPWEVGQLAEQLGCCFWQERRHHPGTPVVRGGRVVAS
jgi:hypothetical protein